VEPPAELVATAQDLVSYRRFLVLYDPREAQRKGLLGPRARPFSIKVVGGDGAVASFPSWSEVVAWHDRALISSGLQVLKQLPEMG
jgi:hypothetical protein